MRLIEEAIAEDPPLAMKEGGIIRDGYHRRGGPSAKAQNQTERTGLQSWRQKNGKRPGSRICGSSITKCSATIWR